MTEVFDFEHYRAEQAGADPDRGLLISFEYQAVKNRMNEFENVPFIRIWMDKNSEVVRQVTEEDKRRFKTRWDAFVAGEEVPEDGTPIKELPFATPANISACKSERIFTAEQLAETPDSKLIRAGLSNFKYMTKDWLASQKDVNHLKALREEIDELKRLNATLREQLYETGKTRVEETSEAPVKKRRGRPRKNGNTSSND